MVISRRSSLTIEWDFTTALMHFGGSFRYWWWPVAAFNKMVENDGISMPQSADKREMQGIVERKHGEGSAKFRAFVPPAAGQNLSDAWEAMPGPGDQEKFVSRLKAELEGDSLDAYIAQLRGHADIPNVQELCSIIKAHFTVEPFNHVTPTDRIELAAFIEMLNETGKLGLDDKDATVISGGSSSNYHGNESLAAESEDNSSASPTSKPSSVYIRFEDLSRVGLCEIICQHGASLCLLINPEEVRKEHWSATRAIKVPGGTLPPFNPDKVKGKINDEKNKHITRCIKMLKESVSGLLRKPDGRSSKIKDKDGQFTLTLGDFEKTIGSAAIAVRDAIEARLIRFSHLLFKGAKISRDAYILIRRLLSLESRSEVHCRGAKSKKRRAPVVAMRDPEALDRINVAVKKACDELGLEVPRPTSTMADYKDVWAKALRFYNGQITSDVSMSQKKTDVASLKEVCARYNHSQVLGY